MHYYVHIFCTMLLRKLPMVFAMDYKSVFALVQCNKSVEETVIYLETYDRTF